MTEPRAGHARTFNSHTSRTPLFYNTAPAVAMDRMVTQQLSSHPGKSRNAQIAHDDSL